MKSFKTLCATDINSLVTNSKNTGQRVHHLNFSAVVVKRFLVKYAVQHEVSGYQEWPGSNQANKMPLFKNNTTAPTPTPK
jgi:hypothetical protein